MIFSFLCKPQLQFKTNFSDPRGFECIHHTRGSFKILHCTIAFMSNQACALVFPTTSCDPHLCLLKVLVLTLKMIKCITECISIKGATKVVPDQFNCVDQKTGVTYMKDRNTS